MPYKRAGTSNWGIVVNGVRRTSGTSSYEAADALEKQLNAAATPAVVSSVTPTGPGVRSWPELCIAWKREKEKTKITWGGDESQIEWLDQFFGELTDIRHITYEVMDALMQAQRGVSLTERIPENSTANRYVALVGAMLNFAATPGTNKNARLAWIPYGPIFRRYPEPEGRDIWLTVEQWFKLLAELPSHYIGPATLAVTTGLRESKVMKLEWSQIDFEKRTLTFKGTANKKGNTIPLNSIAWQAITQAKAQKILHPRRVFYYLPKSARELRFKSGKVATPQPLTRPGDAFYKAMKRAELGDWTIDADGGKHWEGFCWHGFRHTFATWLRDTDAPDWALDALCGWVSKSGTDGETRRFNNETRERYAHRRAEKCREYSERIVELLNGQRELSPDLLQANG